MTSTFNTALPVTQYLDFPIWKQDKTALIFNDRQTSYPQTIRAAKAIANYLVAKGVKPGDRIALLARNSDYYLILNLASHLVGAVAVGINWRLTPSEIQFIAADSESVLFFVGDDFVDSVHPITDQLPLVRDYIGMGQVIAGYQDSIAAIIEQEAYGSDTPAVTSQLSGDDTLVQLYTSGTTGLPKGVVSTHSNFTSAFNAMTTDWLNPQDFERLLNALPMYHIAGLNVALIGLLAGGTGVVMNDFDPVGYLKNVQDHKITGGFLVPAAIQFIVNMPQVDEFDLSSLCSMSYGASPINESTLKLAMQKLGCRFQQVYGMTETSGYGTYLTHDDHVKGGKILTSCGKAGSAAEVSILDENNQALPVGQIGQIALRSSANMVAYWKRPEATAETITPEGWLLTGDAGFVDEDGYVYIHDRMKDMIISGGENVYPNEVENVLTQHESVMAAACIGIPEARFGEAVHAVLVAAPGCEPLTIEQLQAFAGEKLAKFKLPKSLEYIDMLPYNPSGKILRRQLKEKHWEGHGRRVN